MSELPEPISGAALVAAGALVTTVFNWVAGRRKVDAEVGVDLGTAWGKLFVEMRADMTRLRADMAARDAACEAQINVKVAEVRNDFDEQVLKLRSIIYSLAKKLPLDAKQAALLAQIAPDTVTRHAPGEGK